MKRFPRIKIRAPTAIFMILLAALDGSLLSFIPIIAAVCHEFGHLFVMLIFGVPVREIEITLFGAEIRTSMSGLGTFGRVIVYFAGAAANIVTGVFVWVLFPRQFPAEFFCACSVSLAIFNLIPIRTLDGGCIFEAICARFFQNRMVVMLDVVSAASLAVLWLAAVYLMLAFGGNISLMLFCIYMFVSLYLR